MEAQQRIHLFQPGGINIRQDNRTIRSYLQDRGQTLDEVENKVCSASLDQQWLQEDRGVV